MLLKNLSFVFSTLIVGKIPKAPGSFGSLLAVLIWWAIVPQSFGLQMLLVFSAFAVGWVATHFYESLYNQHDPKEVVVDELIGMWMTLLFVPKAVGLYAIGFLLFRLFDIWKPWPVGWIDKEVPGALGTILDDVAAGAIAFVLIQIYLRYLGLAA